MLSGGTVCEFASQVLADPPEQKCATRQGVHTTDALGLYCPFTHVVHSVEPATETCVFEHSEHVETEAVPGTLKNVSTGHNVHTAFALGFAV